MIFVLSKEERVSDLGYLPFCETGSNTDRAAPPKDISDSTNADISRDGTT